MLRMMFGKTFVWAAFSIFVERPVTKSKISQNLTVRLTPEHFSSPGQVMTHPEMISGCLCMRFRKIPQYEHILMLREIYLRASVRSYLRKTPQ